jgi:hypothetical protein
MMEQDTDELPDRGIPDAEISLGTYRLLTACTGDELRAAIDFARRRAAGDFPAPYRNMNARSYELAGRYLRAEEAGDTAELERLKPAMTKLAVQFAVDQFLDHKRATLPELRAARALSPAGLAMRTTSEIAHAIALRMLHADALGCSPMVEDILTAAEAEHGHTIAMWAYDEYRWMADGMDDDSERAQALRNLAAALQNNGNQQEGAGQ